MSDEGPAGPEPEAEAEAGSMDQTEQLRETIRETLRLGDKERAPELDVILGDFERRFAIDWVGEHLPQVRRSAYGQRSLYWALGVGFVVGLAAYAGGYALKSSVTTEPLGFVGDLLYTLGWALWTGVVVALFLQVIPETKRRGYKQLLEAYEADRRKARDEGDH